MCVEVAVMSKELLLESIVGNSGISMQELCFLKQPVAFSSGFMLSALSITGG